MSEEHRVDLNEASAEELEEVGQLDGERARYLVEHRSRAGRFRTWDDVKQVPSFEEGMVERLQQAGFTLDGEDRGSDEASRAKGGSEKTSSAGRASREEPAARVSATKASAAGGASAGGKASGGRSGSGRAPATGPGGLRRGGGSLDEGSGRRRTRTGHDLNRATAEELEQVHMIGAERARRLITFREQRGPFADWEQVKEVLGYEDGLVERLQQAGFGLGGRG